MEKGRRVLIGAVERDEGRRNTEESVEEGPTKKEERTERRRWKNGRSEL